MAASWGVSFDRPTAQHGCVARVLRSPSTILRTCSIGYTCFETLLHVMGQCISLRKAPVSQEPAQYQVKIAHLHMHTRQPWAPAIHVWSVEMYILCVRHHQGFMRMP